MREQKEDRVLIDKSAKYYKKKIRKHDHGGQVIAAKFNLKPDLVEVQLWCEALFRKPLGQADGLLTERPWLGGREPLGKWRAVEILQVADVNFEVL